MEIPSAVREHFFDEQSLKILRFPSVGVSGTKVVLVESGGSRYAVKFGIGQTPLHRLVEKRAILAQFPSMADHLVEIHNYCTYKEGAAQCEAILMDAVIGPSLHELAIGEKVLALEVQEDILTSFRAVWNTSKIPFGGKLVRDPKARAAKAAKAAKEVLARHSIGQEKCLVINGEEIGSLTKLAPLFERYEYPASQVICQQDLIGDNFLIDGNGRWFATDLEWVGYHDWKSSASRAYGWWKTMASEGSASVRHVGNRSDITYQLTLAKTCEELQNICLNNFRIAANELEEKTNWQEMFWLLVGYSLLAQLRFSRDRNRDQFDLPILAEGLSILVRSDQMQI